MYEGVLTNQVSLDIIPSDTIPFSHVTYTIVWQNWLSLESGIETEADVDMLNLGWLRMQSTGGFQ